MCDKEQFEKVIKALQLTKSNPVEGWDYRGEGFDGAMVHTSTALIDAAIDLIRDCFRRITELEAMQTARLMTLEEVHEMSWDYCYLEEEVIKDKVLKMYCGAYRVKCITWPSIASCVLTFGDGAYGKRWRCWTQRPTNEQRKAVRWDATD